LYVLACLALIALLLLGLWPTAASQAQSPDRLVLAFYYTWFDNNTWANGRLPDLPAELYASSDRGAIARHIEQAKAAGIDAFVVSWYGPQTENNQTETNLRILLDEAATRGFRIAVDVEVRSPFLHSAGDVQGAVAALLATHAQHPAYLRSGGKPVVFFWRQQRFNLDTWAAIRRAVDPDHVTLWIEEGVDVAPLAVFDGHHLYSVTWNPPTDLSYTANKFAKRVRAAASTLGAAKVYVATVMPGYDDRSTGRGNAFAIGRENGAYYERSWQAAIGSAPDWIIITSFNEWPEGTYIEPSRAHGARFLELTGAWAAAFRGAPMPQIAPPQPAKRAASAPPTAKPRPTSVPTPTPVPHRLPPEHP
jgi:hypothetical protein